MCLAVDSDQFIYVAQDPERAGSALVTLALDDLDAHERRLRETGLTFVEEASKAAPRRLVVSDIDGNSIAFFQDPTPTGASNSPGPVFRNDP